MDALARADPAVQAERRAWLAALGQPERLSVPVLAARVDAGARRSARRDSPHALDWLIAWTADLARIVAGGTARRNPDAAVPLGAFGRTGSADCAVSYHRSLLRQRAMLAHPLQPRLSRRRFSGLPGPVLTMAENKTISTMSARGRPARVRRVRQHPRACRALWRTCRFSRVAASSFRHRGSTGFGEEVFMLLSLMDDPNRIAVGARWSRSRRRGPGQPDAGIGVQFTQDETGANARATIEQILGETLGRSGPRTRCKDRPRLWTRVEPGPMSARHARGAQCRDHPSADVRRLSLPSRFPRACVGSAGAARGDGRCASHPCAVHSGQPAGLACSARAGHGASESLRDRRRASGRRRHAGAHRRRPGRAGRATEGGGDRRNGARLLSPSGRRRLAARAVPHTHPRSAQGRPATGRPHAGCGCRHAVDHARRGCERSEA